MIKALPHVFFLTAALLATAGSLATAHPGGHPFDDAHDQEGETHINTRGSGSIIYDNTHLVVPSLSLQDVMVPLDELIPEDICTEVEFPEDDRPSIRRLELIDSEETLEGEITHLGLAGFTVLLEDGGTREVSWAQVSSRNTQNLLRNIDDDDEAQALMAMYISGIPKDSDISDVERRARMYRDRDEREEAAERAYEWGVRIYNSLNADWEWDKLREEDQELALEVQRTSADERMTQLFGENQFLFGESDHFLFYTNLEIGVASEWAEKLERTYDHINSMFGVRDPNVFHGKCLLYILDSQTTYTRLCQTYGFAMGGSAGVSFPGREFNGSASIAFFDNPSNAEYTDIVLYHEMTHAYIDRYHGNNHLPSWIHEGVAEIISDEMSRSGNNAHENKLAQGMRTLENSGRLAGFFGARNISFDNYGIAMDLSRMLTGISTPAYIEMIRDMQEGIEPETALSAHYEMDFTELTSRYGQRVGLPNLTYQ